MEPSFEANVGGIEYKSFGDSDGIELKWFNDETCLGVPKYSAICQIGGIPCPVKLGVIFQVMDLNEILEPYEHEYRFCIETQIVVLNPISNEFLARAASCYGDEISIEDMDMETKVRTIFDYAGGIPVFIDSVSGAGNKAHESDFAEQKCAWFTGPWGNKYIRFRDEETALAWLKEVYAPNMRAIFGLIGFTLDRPINRIGTTGWNVVEQWTRNKDMYRMR